MDDVVELFNPYGNISLGNQQSEYLSRTNSVFLPFFHHTASINVPALIVFPNQALFLHCFQIETSIKAHHLGVKIKTMMRPIMMMLSHDEFKHGSSTISLLTLTILKYKLIYLSSSFISFHQPDRLKPIIDIDR